MPNTNRYILCAVFAMAWVGIRVAFGESTFTDSVDETPVPTRGHELRLPDESDSEEDRWFLLMGNINVHPRLSDASRQIDREINRPLRLLAPTFRDVRTFADQRDDFMVWSGMLGGGRILSPKWAAFVQTGYTAGKVRTKGKDVTWFLLPIDTHVELHRSSFFAGAGVDIFPWGMPRRDRYTGLRARLVQTRPLFACSLNWNYLTFDAEVKAGPWPVGSLFRRTESRSWSAWNMGLAVGLETPLTPRSSLVLMTTYNHFFKYGGDFSGPSFSIIWKRYF